MRSFVEASCRNFNNYDLTFKYMVSRLLDPTKELGARRSDVIFTVALDTAERLGLGWVKERVKEALPWAKLYICRQGPGTVVGAAESKGVLESHGLECVAEA